MSAQRSPTRALRRLSPLGSVAIAAAAALSWTSAAPGQASIRRVTDVDDTPVGRSSNPEFGAELPGGICIFAATDITNGREVWRTRSGAAPVLLKDILPGQVGSNPRDFVLFQGEVWFSASDGQNGRELWRTDGTATGTVLVVDLFPGPGGSAPSGLAVQGNRLFFSAFDDQAGREPHVSNGTAAGTRLLKDVQPGSLGSDVEENEDDPHLFFPSDVGNLVFFAADDGTSGVELWKSDGTTSGTALVVDLNPGTDEGFDPGEPPVVLNGTLLFRADDGGGTGSELYKSDGTAAGTVRVRDIRAGAGSSFPRDLVVHQGKVYFSAVDTSLGRELFESDGTFAGTTLVVDLRPGSGSSNPFNLASCGNLIYFSASADQASTEPHISDGTAQGTVRLADVNPGVFASLPDNFTCCGNLVFFSARTRDEGDELFVTDGRVGNVTLLRDFLPGTDFGDPEGLVCCNGTLLGAATTPQGRELISSDGTPAGTVVVDLDPTQTTQSSNPREFQGVDLESFYFIGTTTLHGSEVFFFDGTRSRALEVIVGRDGSSPQKLTVVGRSAYWTARTSAEGRELYRSIDGGPAELVADLRPGSLSSSPNDLVAFDHQTLVCTARTPNQGTELIVVRNDQPGVQIFDLRPGAPSSSPGRLTKLIDPDTGANFVILTATDDTVGNELFAFDGVGVQVAVDFNPGGSGSSPRKLVGNADDSAILLEAFINGSTRLVRLTVDENPGGLNVQFIVEELFNIGRSFLIESILDPDEALFNFQIRAFLLMTDPGAGQTGTEPYVLDDQGNVHLISDVFGGPTGSDGTFLGQTPDGFVMTATNEEGETEVYQYDALLDQFVSLEALPGPESSNPEQGVSVGDGALFTGSVTVDTERAVVFVEDGRVAEALGIDPDGLRDPVNLGSEIIGGAVDLHAGGGREPVAIQIPTAQASEFGVPCDGRARTWATTPKVGQTSKWKTVGGQPGDFGFQVVGPAAPTQNVFGCDLYIDANALITAFSGTAPGFESSVVISNDTALVGVEFVTQGVWVPTDGRSPVFTNGVYQGIGN